MEYSRRWLTPGWLPISLKNPAFRELDICFPQCPTVETSTMSRSSGLSLRMVAGYSEGIGSEQFLVAEA